MTQPSINSAPVLVTGGTGFVGQAILARLFRDQIPIRLLARSPESPSSQKMARQYQAQLVRGDILEVCSLPKAMEGVQAVIHLVGIIREFKSSTFEAVHAGGTRNVLQAMKTAGIDRLVHMSALGTRPGAVSRYHQSKWAAEEAVRQSGLRFTIFRPSIIYGPNDEFVNLFAGLIRKLPAVGVFGSGQSKLQPIHVDEVATAFVKALQEPAAEGKTFDLCGPVPLTFNEVLETIMKVMGRKRPKIHLPLWSARSMAATFEKSFPLILRRPAPLNRDQLIMLQEDNTGDPCPAQEFFGLRLEPFETGMARYLQPSGKTASR